MEVDMLGGAVKIQKQQGVPKEVQSLLTMELGS